MRTLRVLVVCTGNKARSQMAEAFLRHYGGEKIEVHSAGTHPSGLWDVISRVMAEKGISMEGHRSKSVSEFYGQEFDWFVTVCGEADRACATFTGGKNRLHVPFTDPWLPPERVDETLDCVRRIRDEIEEWARRFVADLPVS